MKETDTRKLAISNVLPYRSQALLKMNNNTISVRTLSDVTEKTNTTN